MNQAFQSALNEAETLSRASRASFNTARLLNAKQAAEYLGVTPYLLNTIPVKPIPFGDGVRPSKRWDRKGLDAWLDEVSGLKPQAPVDAVPDLEEEMAEWGARYGH